MLRFKISACLVILFKVKHFYSTILNGTVSELLWPQMRSSIANYLVKYNILDGPLAYKKVFERIPDSGNCWCFSDKHETSKGDPQDLYDAACRRFHYCIRCGYNSNITDYDENVIVAFNMKEPTSSFNISLDLVNLVESNNMMNFDSAGNSVSIYEWEIPIGNVKIVNLKREWQFVRGSNSWKLILSMYS